MLYFLDLLKREEIKEFKPRVPEITMDSEDRTIERICLAKSISGCLTSAPWGNKYVENFPENLLFRVYAFDKADIKEDNLITPERLYETDKVRDAEITGECWVINQSLKPKRVFYIVLEKCFFEAKDSISFKNLDKEHIEDYIEGSIVSVRAEYREIPRKDILFGNTFNMNIEELLKEHYELEIEEEADFILNGFIRVENKANFVEVLDNNLIIKTDLEEGLYLKAFVEKLKENLK